MGCSVTRSHPRPTSPLTNPRTHPHTKHGSTRRPATCKHDHLACASTPVGSLRLPSFFFRLLHAVCHGCINFCVCEAVLSMSVNWSCACCPAARRGSSVTTERLQQTKQYFTTWSSSPHYSWQQVQYFFILLRLVCFEYRQQVCWPSEPQR